MKFKLGDKVKIDGTECQVKYINAGSAYVSPVKDDTNDPRIARHIAYAKLEPRGKIKKL